MKAIEFLKNKGITRATCYTDGKTYYVDELAKLMEEYAALRQPLVSSSFLSEYDHNCMMHLDKQRTCMVCGKQNCC